MEIICTAEQTQRNLFQEKEEEMVKKWERWNRKEIFLWARAEMTDDITLKSSRKSFDLK